MNPALVMVDDQGKPFTVRYDEVNAMLLNEFLKEHRKVEEQQATITQVESNAERQEATITHLESAVAHFESTVGKQQKEIQALTAALKAQAAQIQKVSDQIGSTSSCSSCGSQRLMLLSRSETRAVYLGHRPEPLRRRPPSAAFVPGPRSWEHATAQRHQTRAGGGSPAVSASFNIVTKGSGQLPMGNVLTAIDNVSANPIAGTFANLADESSISVAGNNFLVSYEGGGGNDLTLTVVP